MPSISAPESALRTDIQALRGIAVLLVLLYHAGMPGLAAGFLGVDIFFVISGFLITGIIRRGIDGGNFSFRGFYYRRAKRLLPAAYLVIVLSVLAAPFFLDEQALADIRLQVVGALTFTVNFVFWQQAGYFDAAAETKPLLHFWSLAIEEQYYLLMPLFLYLMARRLWLPAVSALLVASFGLALWQNTAHPDAAFYLLPARWWELGIGSVGALVAIGPRLHRLLSVARLPALAGLIAIPIYPTGLPHPGVDAAIVCLATLVLILGRNGNALESSVPVRGLAFVGDFSYSLYLVHWPVIVFTRSAYLETAPHGALAVAVLVSVVLAYLLYLFVEEPFRRGFFKAPRKTVAGLLAASVAIAALPVAVSAAAVRDEDWAKLRRTNYGIDRACAFGDRFVWEGVIPDGCKTSLPARFLIQGDSYAMAWASALMGPLADEGLAQATMSACDPLLGMARYPRSAGGRYNRDTAESCMNVQRGILDHVSNDPAIETVILAARFQTILLTSGVMIVETPDGIREEKVSPDLAASGLAAMVDAYRAAGKKVVILAPPPANGMNIGECLERRGLGKIVLDATDGCALPRESVASYRRQTRAFLEKVSRLADVAVVDVSDFLCDAERCATSIDGVPLYRDGGPLSVDGAMLIGRQSSLVEDIQDSSR